MKGMPPGVYAEIPNDAEIPDDGSAASGRGPPQARSTALRVFLVVVVAMAAAAAVIVAKIVLRRWVYMAIESVVRRY